MSGWFAQLGQNAAGQAVSGGIALGLSRLGSRYDRKQQLRAQQQMMGLQMQGEKEMMEYQQMKQLEMWEKTGYGAQMEQMKKAGLNPALMYGMGGGGGQTTGGGVPQVSGGQAPYVDTTGMGIQAGMQMAMQQAQIELIKAQTTKTNTEAGNIGQGGIDTLGKEKQIQNLSQGIENQQAAKEIMEIQANILRIEEEIKGATQNAAKAMVMQELRSSFEKMEILKNDAMISDATIKEKIRIITEEAIGAYAKNELTRAQTKATDQSVKLSVAQIDNMAKQIAVAYAGLHLQEGGLTNQINQTEINKKLQEFETSFGKQAGNVLQSLLAAAGKK